MKEIVIDNRIYLAFDKTIDMGSARIKYCGTSLGSDLFADTLGNIYRCNEGETGNLRKMAKAQHNGTSYIYLSGKRISVASLVAKAFFGKKAEDTQLIHLNGHSEDNRISNIAIDITQKWDGVRIERINENGREKPSEVTAGSTDGAEGAEKPVQQLRKVPLPVSGGHSGSRKAVAGKKRSGSDAER